VPVEGSTNPLMESAAAIGEPAADHGGEGGSSPQPTPSNEPAVGSFERFMGTFGNPKRWAGH